MHTFALAILNICIAAAQTFPRMPPTPQDSVVKIVDRDCVIALESILGQDNLRRRLVNEYTWDAKKNEYAMSRMSVELGQYLADEGYHVVKVGACCLWVFWCWDVWVCIVSRRGGTCVG